MKVSITGHRWLSPKDYRVLLERMTLHVLDFDVEEIFFGGAIGADTESLAMALEKRIDRYPRLTVVVPDTVDAQPRDTQGWTRRADRIIELRNPIRREDGFESYHIRNRFLVDQIRDEGQLTAFWSGRQQGGTYRAIEYAVSIDAAWEHVLVEGQ